MLLPSLVSQIRNLGVIISLLSVLDWNLILIFAVGLIGPLDLV